MFYSIVTLNGDAVEVNFSSFSFLSLFFLFFTFFYRPTNEEMKNREDLEDKITQIITQDIDQQQSRLNKNKDEKNAGYFLKFSTRAPKDAISIDKEDASLPISEQIAKKIRKLRV